MNPGRRKVSEGQLRYYARRCAHATSDRCDCLCGGALHRQTHPESWIKGLLAEQQAQAFYVKRGNAREAGQGELFPWS